MSFKRLFLPFLLILLLTSCSGQIKAFYLESDSESEVFLINKEIIAHISLDSSTLASFRSYSLSEASDSFEKLFGVKSESYGYIPDSAKKEMEDLVGLLAAGVGKEADITTISHYYRDLRKTEFVDTMNELSDSFDYKALLDSIKDGTPIYEYSLEDILPPSAPWEDKMEFLQLWILNAMRK